jgi:Putative  PD-(D/E)XK family member, (DUF4420)
VTPSSRHLTEAALDEFMAAGPQAAVRIPGRPEAHMVFLPGNDGGVALRVAWDGSALPDLTEYEHLSASVITVGGQAWSELIINDPDVARRAMPAIWLIIDRIQLEQITFAAAVIETLADFRELLVGAPGLSSDREVGLIGELLVLDSLVSALGGTQALTAWRGPNRDEHDFDLGSGDLEVKATLSERRVHWIGSLGQLEPTPGRPLWLLSVQLTTGIAEATTIFDLISGLRLRLEAADAERFEDELYSAGWREKYRATARRRFRLRSAPVLFPVNEGFPALTTARVAAAGMPLERLREVAYSVDVTGLAADPCPPPALSKLLSQGGA